MILKCMEGILKTYKKINKRIRGIYFLRGITDPPRTDKIPNNKPVKAILHAAWVYC